MTEQRVESLQQSKQGNEFDFGHGKFVLVRAKPSGESESMPTENSRPIVYLAGHNLDPRTGVAKAGFDIQQIADASGSEVISFAFLGGRPHSLDLAQGYPDGARIPTYYADKAGDIHQALRQMREKGQLDNGPLDLIAYSDGGPIALTMVEQYPNGFQNVELVNAVGLDNKGAARTAGSVSRELVRVLAKKAYAAGRRMVQRAERGGTEEQDGKLKFDPQETRALTPWEKVMQWGRIGRQLGTEHASVARSSMHTLIANLLQRNGNLRFGIFTTERDKIVSQRRTEKYIGQTLGSDETRVAFETTGWDQHMIGKRQEGRSTSLKDMGRWMRGMRQTQTVKTG